MTPHYTYTPSTEFISNLIFEYVETYSLQRGEAYELQQSKFDKEYEKLKDKKAKHNDLNPDEEDRFMVLDKLCGTTQYLLDDKNQFHYSSQKTNVFKANDPAVHRIKQILHTEIVDIPRWLCAPVYRDAIVFYDKDDQIVTALNICLGCQYMETKKFNHINGDYRTYDLLKRFFIDIGHKVEDPEYSALDDINKIKAKI